MAEEIGDEVGECEGIMADIVHKLNVVMIKEGRREYLEWKQGEKKKGEKEGIEGGGNRRKRKVMMVENPEVIEIM